MDVHYALGPYLLENRGLPINFNVHKLGHGTQRFRL